MDYTLSQLFKTLVEQGASDLHISSGSPPRLRIDGSIVPLNLPQLTAKDAQELCYSVLTEQQKKKFESDKELDFSFSVKNLSRFRANLYYKANSVAAAFRVVPYKLFSIQELGLPPVVTRLCHKQRGLILVTGPTGSGKSTTLASMINIINENRYCHIVTIEDPIEFIHAHKNSIINQREVGGDTHSFSKALKSVLRQDPDIIMVGEMRDLETISAALTLAETGHLVFGTLHTNSSIASINRLIDAFPPHQQAQIRTQLAMTLEAVISQTLIVSNRGGRCLALEIMVKNNAISALINEGKINQIYSSMQSGQSESGMLTMNQSLANLVARRIINKEIALSYSRQPDELQDLIISAASKKSPPRR